MQTINRIVPNLICLAALATMISFKIHAIDLQVPNRESIVELPNGNADGSLLYGKKTPYEPYSPVAIIMTKLGDFAIINGVNGIAVFDNKFKFKARLGSGQVLYDGFSTYGSYLIVWPWRPPKESQLVEVFDLATSKQKRYSYGDFVGKGRPTTVTGLEGTILIQTDSDLLVPMKLVASKLVPVDSSQFLVEHENQLNFVSGKLYEKGIGLITSSAEIFFQDTGQNELQIAQSAGDLDNINLANGTVFSIDSQGNRYIYEQGGRIGVATKSGDLIVVFDIRYGLKPDTMVCLPCINGVGDIIYIESSIEKHKIVKISRTW